ncbi:MAG: RNA polymerase sigma-54 factor [Comamonadaceae bacterium]|nr:MAG: RNA polymerase sigma-54 factor [Comamonadaceae bacterium]
MQTIGLQTRTAQTTTFSPRLQHAVRLLQMSTLDYAQALQDTALANPFLDIEQPDPVGLAAVEAERTPDAVAAAEMEWAQGLDRMVGNEPSAGQRLSHDDSFDLLQSAPVRSNLRAHLHAQLGVLRLDATERFLAEAVIEALDDDGYLRLSLDELTVAAAGTGMSIGAASLADELRTALCRVQSFDPAGVAARSVAECLSLQLAQIADAEVRALAQRIVHAHLDLLATRKLQRIAQQLGVDAAHVQQAVDCILKLDPRPGSRYADLEARAVVPDVVVRKVGGVWKTALNGGALPRVRMNQAYASMFEKHRQAGDGEMKSCLDQARWTVQNLTQRASTILDTAKAIVARQKLFLEYGHLAMKPLGLREVADAVGVHPSTISRAVHHKYIATPHGVFELHHFFSRGMTHSGGGASAPVALQALIRELIESERPEAPWSDAALARELEKQGFHIARRTVTKYRQGLAIEAVERRRAVTPAAGA